MTLADFALAAVLTVPLLGLAEAALTFFLGLIRPPSDR